MRFIFYLFVFTVLVFKGYSQSLISSNTYIQACIDKTQCSSINNSSYLFYDETAGNLYLKVDFEKFKIGHDSIDDWLNDLTGTYLYYKAPLSPESFKGISNPNQRTLKLNGQLYLNGIWQSQSIEITLYSSESSLISTSTNGNAYDNLKINFSLSILPRDFKLHKKPHHLRKTIFIGVALGRINLLPPGSRHLVGEAYDH